MQVCYTADLSQTRACAIADANASKVSIGTLLARGVGSDSQEGSLCTLGTDPANPVLLCHSSLTCLPFDINGAEAAGYGYCAAPAPPAAAPASPSSSADNLPITLRFADGGLQCRLPIVAEGQLLTDCTAVNGTQTCYTANLTAVAACNMTYASETVNLQDLLAGGRASDGQVGGLCSYPSTPDGTGYSCLSGLSCLAPPAGSRLADFSFGYCANLVAAVGTQDAVSALTALSVAQRFTVSGEACRLPLVYNEQLLTDCSSDVGLPQASCFVDGRDEPQQCAPVVVSDSNTTTAAELLAQNSVGFQGNSGAQHRPLLA